MFDEIDRAYYRRRASELAERARNSLDPGIARTHQQLADQYAVLAQGDRFLIRQQSGASPLRRP